MQQNSALGSLLRQEDGDVGSILPVLCLLPASSPANVLGLGNAAQGRTHQSLSPQRDRDRMGFAWAGAQQGSASPAKPPDPELHALCKAPGNPDGYTQALNWS